MRAGLALPTVVLLLAMTSALVVGGTFITRQLVAAGSVADRSAALDAAVEEALSAAVTDWDSVARSAQPLGIAAVLASRSQIGQSVDVWATRLGPRSYWLVAESRSNSKPALRRRIGLIIRVTKGVPVVLPQQGWFELP